MPVAGADRLPPDTYVGVVRLHVADLDRSIDYYTEVIGLGVVGRDQESAVLGSRGDGRPLVQLHAKAGLLPAPRRGANGLFHFAILLPDRAALGRFVAHLLARRLPFGSADHLVSEALYLSDPDGLGIEVYVDRPRQSWRQVNGELAMATDPLDLTSVAAAGAGQPWAGTPAGTTMGHIHLHVADLAAARRFYHDALGFDVTGSRYPGALFLSAGGYHHHLGLNTWGSGANATEAHARLLDWELHVPGSAAAVAQRLGAAGYRAEREGAAWIAADPWGTRVVLRDGLAGPEGTRSS